jgi:hypothetical protein
MTINYVEQSIKPIDDGSPSTTPSKTNINDAIAALQLRGYLLASSAVASSAHTGTTAETAIATVSIPAGAMGPNGMVRIRTYWSGMTSSASAKTVRHRFGTIAGTSHAPMIWTTKTAGSGVCTIQNRNATNSQLGTGVADRGTDLLQSTLAATTGAIDTTAAVSLVISAQLADGGEAMVLEYYHVEVFYGA